MVDEATVLAALCRGERVTTATLRTLPLPRWAALCRALRDQGYALRCDARGAVPLPPDSRWWAEGGAR